MSQGKKITSSRLHGADLLEAQPEVLGDDPGLPETMEVCRGAVAHAASKQPDVDARWQQLRNEPKACPRRLGSWPATWTPSGVAVTF